LNRGDFFKQRCEADASGDKHGPHLFPTGTWSSRKRHIVKRPLGCAAKGGAFIVNEAVIAMHAVEWPWALP